MAIDLKILILSSLGIGFLHTIMGPDHYVPFIVMARARGWSIARTLWITFLCGLGHVGSSVVLGLIGIMLGVAVHKLELIEAYRGNIAAWLLIGFGLAYGSWGIVRAYKNKPHRHGHFHADGTFHSHEHTHSQEHAHLHEDPKAPSITPWVLFTIFVLGPCEPLIPLVMYPAAQSNWLGLWLVVLAFGTVTVVTMMSIVALTTAGLNFVPLGRLERYTHALAGFAIFFSGLAIQLLGL